MPRTVRDARLESRAARQRLKPQHEPYWRAIDGGMHIGYRKGSLRATFIARYRTPTGRYLKAVVGLADDTQDADNKAVFSFSQAQTKARKWFEEQTQERSQDAPQAPTVQDAVDGYLFWFKAHRKSVSTTLSVINAFILPTFGKIPLRELTSDMIERWHIRLTEMPPRKRRRVEAAPLVEPPTQDEEALRRRRATANRILTVLKAVLVHARKTYKVIDTETWRSVKPFREVDSPIVRHLSLDEVSRLIDACAPDLRNLVRAAVLTGCRYGELARLKAADVQLKANCISVAQTKSGQSRQVFLSAEGTEFFSELAQDKEPKQLILVRGNGSAWAKSYQFRPLRRACKRANIAPPVSFHILRHTFASHLAMAGAPLSVIKTQLGHADIRMTDRHYAHLNENFVLETVRRSLPKFAR